MKRSTSWITIGVLILLPLISKASPLKPTIGLNYIYVTDNAEGFGSSIPGVVTTFGYNLNLTDNLLLTPSLKIGTGINSGYGKSHKVRLDTLAAISMVVRYKLNNGLHFLCAPTYSERKFSVLYGATNPENPLAQKYLMKDPSDYGIGFGIGFFSEEALALELSYEFMDEARILNFGFNVSF